MAIVKVSENKTIDPDQVSYIKEVRGNGNKSIALIVLKDGRQIESHFTYKEALKYFPGLGA